MLSRILISLSSLLVCTQAFAFGGALPKDPALSSVFFAKTEDVKALFARSSPIVADRIQVNTIRPCAFYEAYPGSAGSLGINTYSDFNDRAYKLVGFRPMDARGRGIKADLNVCENGRDVNSLSYPLQFESSRVSSYYERGEREYTLGASYRAIPNGSRINGVKIPDGSIIIENFTYLSDGEVVKAKPISASGSRLDVSSYAICGPAVAQPLESDAHWFHGYTRPPACDQLESDPAPASTVSSQIKEPSKLFSNHELLGYVSQDVGVVQKIFNASSDLSSSIHPNTLRVCMAYRTGAYHADPLFPMLGPDQKTRYVVLGVKPPKSYNGVAELDYHVCYAKSDSAPQAQVVLNRYVNDFVSGELKSDPKALLVYPKSIPASSNPNEENPFYGGIVMQNTAVFAPGEPINAPLPMYGSPNNLEVVSYLLCTREEYPLDLSRDIDPAQDPARLKLCEKLGAYAADENPPKTWEKHVITDSSSSTSASSSSDDDDDDGTF